MKVVITKITRQDKDKKGNPYMTKATPNKPSRPYTRVGLKTQEHGDKWLSGFENRTNANWKEGDSVEIEVEQKGEYLNFRNLSETEMIWKELANLKNRVGKLEGDQRRDDEQNNEPDDSDLPF